MQPKSNNTMKTFIPFLKATLQVLEEITQEHFTKKNIYPFTGNISKGDIKVQIGIIGDIQSRVVFDFPESFTKKLAVSMMGMMEDEIDEEMSLAAIQELGNIISGTAVGFLEELGINCDITPPTIFDANSQATLFQEQTQLGVIEFTGAFGDFNIYLVTNESQAHNSEQNIISLNFDESMNETLSRFFIPRGMTFVKVTEENFQEKIAEYPPYLILLNTDIPNPQNFIPLINEIPSTAHTSIVLCGSLVPKFKIQFKNIFEKHELKDAYDLLDFIKKNNSSLDLNLFSQNPDVIKDIKPPLKAKFFVTTKTGEKEQIPLSKMGLQSFVLDISNHNDINYPEGKTLSKTSLELNETLLPVVKAQIGKTNLDNGTVDIFLKHVLETEIYKISDFMYALFSK